MNRSIAIRALGAIMLLALLSAAPFLVGQFFVTITIFLLINLILVASLRLITTIGLWSSAHIALMGVGGYAAALTVSGLGWPVWLGLPIGVVASAAVSLLISFPLLRTKHLQFFLASYAASEAIRWIWILFRKPFGGYDGILIRHPQSILGISLPSANSLYYLVLVCTVLSLAIMYRLEKSRIGETAKSIAMAEDLSKSIGIRVDDYRRLLFVAGSLFAGLAGVLFGWYTGTVSPGQYSFTYSIDIVIFVIVGGTASFAGPIIGAVLLTALGEVLRDFLAYLPLIYGIILIVVVLVLPGGLVSLPARIRAGFAGAKHLHEFLVRTEP